MPNLPREIDSKRINQISAVFIKRAYKTNLTIQIKIREKLYRKIEKLGQNLKVRATKV
jgi:hypothetical protein